MPHPTLYSHSDNEHARRWVVVGLLVLLQIAMFWYFEEQRQMTDDEYFRVALPSTEITAPRLTPYGPGIDTELIHAFCAETGKKPVFVYIDNWQAGWEMLEQGKVSVLVGPGLRVQNATGDLSWNTGISPGYAQSSAMILHDSGRYALRRMNQLCGQNMYIQDVEELARISNELFRKLGCEPVFTSENVPSLPGLMNSLEVADSRYGIAEGNLFKLWQPFRQNMRISHTLKSKLTRNWVWDARNKDLAAQLKSFWKKKGTKLAKELAELYFGFLPKQTDYYELWHIDRTILKKLEKYRKWIVEYSKKYKIDPLFLTAVIYRESRFEVKAVSRTGVRGLMMLSQDTARFLDISNRTDPRQSIKGGAKYLRYLYDRLDGYDLDPWTRWFVTLAAYNQGINHARDAIALTKRLRQDHTHWPNVASAYRLLQRKKYYSRAAYGYTRGYEAVEYVQQVRYFYYILKGLAVLDGAERDKLAPFTGAVPAGWPLP